MMFEELTQTAAKITKELLNLANLDAGNLLVAGCSTSEVAGQKIGTDSSPEIAKAVLDGILPECREHGIFLAAQCCEHLNRALILEREAAERYGYDPVNVVPQPKAGGSFAAALYSALEAPVAVESIQAHAGIDIGDTLIGMHLKAVAVPVRLSVKHLGNARIVCARTRPKYIGGERACYR